MCLFYRSSSSSFFRALSRSFHVPARPVPKLCGALAFLLVLAPLASCGSSAHSSHQMADPASSGFRIASTAFSEGGFIPSRFTCSGEDISPALRWTAPPNGTRSFILIVEDPDAPGGIWTHWVVYNLPAQARAVPENVPKQGSVPAGGLQGLNSFGHIGYGGPCPPPGNPHHYYFRLYAMDTTLSLKAGASKGEVLAAAKGHILGEAHLMGRFGR